MPGVVGVLQCWALAEQASPGSVREPAYACASLRERTSHASQSHVDYQGPGDWFGRSASVKLPEWWVERGPGHNGRPSMGPSLALTPKSQRFSGDAKRNQPPNSAFRPRLSRLASSHLALCRDLGVRRPPTGTPDSRTSCNSASQVFSVRPRSVSCMLLHSVRVWTQIRRGGRRQPSASVPARSTLRHFLSRTRLRHGRARRLSEHRR